MALTSTMYALQVALANVDRGVYESLEFRMAMHPSESPEYFVARLLAYCLEYSEGIAFSRGISDPDEPPLSVRDLTGSLKVWIELGAPDAARLHKASKAAPRVVIYTHRDPAQLWRQWEGEKIHRAEQIELYVLERALIDAIAEKLDRRMKVELSVTDGTIFVNMAGSTLSGTVQKLAVR
ncbi:YaeQ family protein [Gemmatimonas sp.]|uniref:YaeQ family protein n=1 Tax=Gemmatimonas sp. TaxID=1962908 RepID=UPI0035679311